MGSLVGAAYVAGRLTERRSRAAYSTRRSAKSQAIADCEIGARSRCLHHSATAKQYSPIFIGRGAPFRNTLSTPKLAVLPMQAVALPSAGRVARNLNGSL